MVTSDVRTAEDGAASSACAMIASSTPNSPTTAAPLSGGVHSGSGVRRDAATHDLVSVPRIQCTHPVDCILNPMQPSFASHAALSAYKFMGLVPLGSYSANSRLAAAAVAVVAFNVLLSGIGALTEEPHHLLDNARVPVT
jgi:hypothetical protein